MTPDPFQFNEPARLDSLARSSGAREVKCWKCEARVLREQASYLVRQNKYLCPKCHRGERHRFWSKVLAVILGTIIVILWIVARFLQIARQKGEPE